MKVRNLKAISFLVMTIIFVLYLTGAIMYVKYRELNGLNDIHKEQLEKELGRN